MKRYAYFDILRVLSAILIIFVHVSAMNWNDIAVNTSKWQVMNFYDCLGIAGVPLFFMISGALLLNSEYEMSLKKLFLKKILHLFILYHVWLLFYNVLPFLMGDMEFSAYNVEEYIAKDFLQGKGIYHLWFLPELIIMYMISPILREAFKTKKVCEYYLTLFVIFGGFMPGVLQFTFPYKLFVESYYTRTSLQMLTGYIGYYVMGHYINTYMPDTISKKYKSILIGTSIISISVIAAICGVDSVIKDSPSVIVNYAFTLLHVVFCFSVFLLFKTCMNNDDKKISKMCSKVARYTMGTYLIHPFVIEILKRLGVGTLYPHTIIMIPLIVAIVFIISLVITLGLSFIPIIKRLIR